MKSVDLNTDWRVTAGDVQYSCDLPHDVTASAARDYSCAFGEYNGYIPETRALFVRELPSVKDDAWLVLSGVCGYGGIFVNDTKVGVAGGYGPHRFVLPQGMLSGAHNELRLELFSSPAMSDKYLGLGIGGGIKLVLPDPRVDIDDGSLFVKTALSGGRTYADVSLDLYNNNDKTVRFVLECAVQNARGKRAGKKQRKICIRANRNLTVSVRVRINNPYEWSTFDPYMYSLIARIVGNDDVEEQTASTRFGVVTRAITATRGIYLNGHNTKMFGAYLSHADAALGCASLYCNEVRRLSALKQLGYNAVHFVGCPTEAMLDACDDVGMLAFVDLSSRLAGAGKAPLDEIFTDFDMLYIDEKIKRLRNHPSVTLYGIADNVSECYGRNGGNSEIEYYCSMIKSVDASRPVTVSASEFVPTRKELELVGCRKTVFDDDSAAINAGREKNLFNTLTSDVFDTVDISGLNYLYPLYERDKARSSDRLTVGARSSPDKAFESINAADKNDRVVGDFCDCGIDYPGGGKFGEILTTTGDIDAIGCEKPQGVYKRILLGERNIAYIVAVDPDTAEQVHLWNWPRFLGQKIDVKVYTSGDVVALYLDGRLIGRKLAGKINKHTASFSLDYYPGTLEAVAYYKGVECARSTLKSAATPKTLKLSVFRKNLSVSRGDVGFVQIEVCDREGELVPYAMRTLCATVTGGELIGFINADPMLRKAAPDSCPAYNGRALAVIRPDPGENKAVVKITGDGLLSSRISFKIKN